MGARRDFLITEAAKKVVELLLKNQLGHRERGITVVVRRILLEDEEAEEQAIKLEYLKEREEKSYGINAKSK